MSQITNYIIALTNLYGMVHIDKVVEIYNAQNEDHISISDVKAIFISYPVELQDGFVHTYKDYFVKEIIMMNDEFDVMLKKKGNKPFYVPDRDGLMNYVEDGYCEKTKQYNDLLQFIQKHFFEPGDERAEWLVDDIQGLVHIGARLEVIFNRLEQMNIALEGIDQANELLQFISNLSNNTRIWENNGFTPKEIHDRFEKPNLNPMPSKSFQFGKPSLSGKIGRNDPCLCGSGKKYKQCCFGKYLS